MAKQIAVLLGAINLDNQRKILDGMISATQKADCNLYVFTNYIGNQENLESLTIASRIFDLPDFSKFDGVILAGNSIFHPHVLNVILEQIRQADVPTVSIDRRYDGMSTIEISSYEAQFKMVEHFITEHNCKNIFYVSGPTSLNNKEAEIRLQAYCDALQKYKLPPQEDHTYEGFFTLEGGVNAAKQILKSHNMPDAIICGNDDMALGVMETFQNAGYRIPKDIKIAGFDNTGLSKISNPSLSTVDQNQYEVGAKAVHEILELIDGKSPETHQVSCILECRESCGCNLRTFHSSIGEKYVAQQHDMLRMTDVLRGMEAAFSKADTTVKLIDVLKNYIPLIGMKEFYLCLCESEKLFVFPDRNLGRNLDILQVNEQFTETMELPLAYKDGAFKAYPKFRKGLLLPESCCDKNSGNVYIVNQIYYQNCCYGYAICGNAPDIASSNLYNLWLMEIGVGFENTRKWMLLKDAVDKLNGMWCYDNLTNLYNRSGFYYEAKTILDQLKAEDKYIFIIFIDADGLKQVNDTIGHEAGDRMIQAIAEIVRKNTLSDMLSMRYGGDEFVLFGGFDADEGAWVEHIAESIRRDVRDANASGQYEFPLSLSMGGSGWRAREVEDLSKLIEQADQQMYEEKRKKKLQK